jgi:hypothetical protein
MVILVVDDLRTFAKLPKGTIYARTVRDALGVLWSLGRIDELWLDHDLGEKEGIRPFVLQIEERAFSGDGFNVGSIVVHTSNPAGGKWILDGLSRYYPVRRVDPLRYL